MSRWGKMSVKTVANSRCMRAATSTWRMPSTHGRPNKRQTCMAIQELPRNKAFIVCGLLIRQMRSARESPFVMYPLYHSCSLARPNVRHALRLHWPLTTSWRNVDAAAVHSIPFQLDIAQGTLRRGWCSPRNKTSQVANRSRILLL